MAKPAYQPSNEKRFTKQTRVNHHALVASNQQMATPHDAANGMEAWRDVAHGGSLPGCGVLWKNNDLTTSQLADVAHRFVSRFGCHNATHRLMKPIVVAPE
ncbi:MAG TPA: hypothetical protein VFR76_06025 [Verrucomicrobiae bacterium]|nr:hypothetical protein [Verrucomicrobiae bacterium]